MTKSPFSSNRALQILITLLCIGIVPSAYAGDVTANFIDTITRIAPTWEALVLPYTIQIFMILWTFDTFRTLVMENLLDIAKIKQVFRFLIVRIAFMGFFTACFVHVAFYHGILEYFAGIAHKALASSGLAPTSTFTGIDAGWIFTQYKEWFANIYTPAVDSLGVSEVGKQFSYAILSIVYLMCCVVIAFQIIFLEIQITLSVYAGVMLSGFAGSKWTISYWNNYLSMIIGLGVKVMVFCFLYAVLQSMLIVNIHYTSGDVWMTMVNAVLATLCICFIPTRISGLVSGAAAGNHGGEMLGAFMMGAALPHKAVGHAMNTAKGVAGVGTKAGGAIKAGGGAINKKINEYSNSELKTPESTQPTGNKNQQPQATNTEDKKAFIEGQNDGGN